MTAIEQADTPELSFIPLPWRIGSAAKAEQVVLAVKAAFETQAWAYFDGGFYYVLAAPTPRLECPEGQERLSILMDLLESLNVTPEGEYLLEPVIGENMDDDEQRTVTDGIQYRFEHVLNLADRLDDIDDKLDALLEDIGEGQL